MNVHRVTLQNGPLTVSIESDGWGDFTVSATASIETITGAGDADLSSTLSERAFQRTLVVAALLVAGGHRHPVQRSDFAASVPGEYDTTMLRTKGMVETDAAPVTWAGSPEGVRHGMVALSGHEAAFQYLRQHGERHDYTVEAVYSG